MKLIAIASIFVLFLFIAINSHACSCREPFPSSITEFASNADSIFIGKVVFGEVAKDNLRYKLIISKVFKGNPKSEVEIYSGFGGGDCGFRFQLNNEYLVYANHLHGILYTGICSKTKLTSKDPKYLEEIDELSKIENNDMDINDNKGR